MSRFFLDDYGFKMPEIPGVSAAYVFSAQYQTVYDSFAVKPAADIAQQQDIMVRALVAAGIWAVLDVFYIFANNTAANAIINWINPGTYDAIEVNAPTFTLNRGYAGNGINQYLRTQFNPVAAAGNFALNDNCFGCYSINASAGLIFDMGMADAAPRQCQFGFTTNAVGVRNYNNSPNTFAVDFNNAPVVLGLRVSDRSGGGNVSSFENGVDQGPGVLVSTVMPNIEFYMLGRNNNGVPAQLSTNQLAAGVFGASLGANNLDLFNALETYLDYVGAGIV